MTKRAMVVAAMILLSAAVFQVVRAQPRENPANAAARAEAMAKLGFLIGEWEGTATFEGPGGRSQQVRQTETVESKLDGTVLLVEGKGYVPVEGGGERLGHEAIATIGYDPAARKYVMRAHSREGFVDPSLEFTGENQFVWGFKVGSGLQVRYTTRLDERGHWVEQGERSMDEGKTWNRFIQMDLQKAGSGGAH